MTFGRVSNDLYRYATRQITPVGISKRLTCTCCGKHRSLGQFPTDSKICISCKPQAPGWRRGGVE